MFVFVFVFFCLCFCPAPSPVVLLCLCEAGQHGGEGCGCHQTRQIVPSGLWTVDSGETIKLAEESLLYFLPPLEKEVNYTFLPNF